MKSTEGGFLGKDRMSGGGNYTWEAEETLSSEASYEQQGTDGKGEGEGK